MATAVSPEVVRELLGYDPETGSLTWKRRARKWFRTDGGYKTWNTRFANKPAFKCDNGAGYLIGLIFGKQMLAHRVAWAHHYGEWPEKHLDHENGKRWDNRIENLREVTVQQNAQNAKLRATNTSGVTGVYQEKSTKRWYAQVKIDGRSKCLGYFDDKSDAIKARMAAEKDLGFHPNHGRAA